MRAKHPIRILEAAVRGMLPKNRLGERIYHHLKVYAGPEHPHEAQKPQRLELAREGHKRGQITEQAAGSMATTPEPTAPAEPAAAAETATVEPVAPVEAEQEQQEQQ